MSSTGQSKEDLATSKSNSSQHEQLLQRLDETIVRFGDDPSGYPPPPTISAEESLIRTYAPKHLESAFHDLYSILWPCLRPRSMNEQSTTASAILMGPRGSGKSLLLHRCLAACQHHTQGEPNQPSVTFRKVEINGIVNRGDDVPSVVYEIVRQLSDMAMQQDFQKHTNDRLRSKGGELENLPGSASPSEGTDEAPRKRARPLHGQDEYLLRLRKSSFTSNLALLESALKMAEVDKIPIVLVLDELDAFMDPKEDRQLLLYHLLDRVATPGSNLVLVGLTSSFSALTQMEKRIRSRAEGTSKIVHVRPPSTYSQLLDILQDKLQPCPIGTGILNLLTPTSAPSTSGEVPTPDDADSTTLTTSITYSMQREFRMARDLRWFSRVVSTSLSLYRLDCALDPNASVENPPKFRPEILVDALSMMGASSISDEPVVSTTKQSNFCLVRGVAVDTRLQALLDLSNPQLSLVLAARRILVREAHREQAIVTPLTLQRMLQEYKSFRRGTQNCTESMLIAAAKQLLERGVLVPSMDHSGGGPLQYHISLSYRTLDPYSLSRLPLHLPVDMERELEEALRRNLLNCSAALKEWGRKTT